MKNISKFWLIIVLISITTLSCRNYKLQTQVHEDGRITRILTVESTDSIHRYDNFAFPVDDTWEVEYYTPNTENEMKEYGYRFSKTYNSYQDLQADYQDIKHVFSDYQRSLKLEKTFKWFYTEYSFSDVIEKKASGNHLSFNQWVEVRNLKLEKPEVTDSLKLKMYQDSIANLHSAWLDSLMLDEFLHALQNDLVNVGADDIVEKMRNKDQSELRMAAEYLFDEKNDSTFYMYCDSVFSTQIFSGFINNESTEVYQFFQNLENYFFLTEIDYSLTMPGEIVHNNAINTEADVLYWKLSSIQAFLVGEKVQATSRTVNYWAIGVTALIVVVLLFIVIRRNASK